MSRIKHSETKFSNENTVRRRAWIERALDGVRSRFDIQADDSINSEESVKPDLYVVKTDEPR